MIKSGWVWRIESLSFNSPEYQYFTLIMLKFTDKGTIKLPISVPVQTAQTGGPRAEAGSCHEARRGGQGGASCLQVVDRDNLYLSFGSQLNGHHSDIKLAHNAFNHFVNEYRPAQESGSIW